MEYVRFGRTELKVSRTSFGALPIQRISFDESRDILHAAFDAGVNFYDTARFYTDSEEKLGCAFKNMRKDIIIATKSMGKTKQEVLSDLEISLRNLGTDHVDILQLHNPGIVPDPDDSESIYWALLEAQKRGMTRFIGYTNHSFDRACEAAKSGKYDSIQFPLNAISNDRDISIIDICRENDLGVLAMKGMSGGLLSSAKMAFSFLRQYENVIPIWGVQKMEELNEFLEYEKNNPSLDREMLKLIEKEKKELGGSFCRSCGYCLPCPVDIPIPNAARMSLLLRRAPYQDYITEEWQEKMARIDNCIDCGACASRCPYSLNVPKLLKEMLSDYREFCKSH